MKVLHVGLSQVKDNFYAFELQGGKAKVTLLNVEAERSEYVGTFVNVRGIELVHADENQHEEYVANIFRGRCLGRSAHRSGSSLVVHIPYAESKMGKLK